MLPEVRTDEHLPTGRSDGTLAARSLAAAGPAGDPVTALLRAIDQLAGVFRAGWEALVAGAPELLARIGCTQTSALSGLALGHQAAMLTCRAFLGRGATSEMRVGAFEAAIAQRFALTTTPAEGLPDLPLTADRVVAFGDQDSLIDQLTLVVGLLATAQAKLKSPRMGQAAATATIALARTAATLDMARAPDLDGVLEEWRAALAGVLSDNGLAWDDSALAEFGTGWDAAMARCLAWSEHPLRSAYDGFVSETTEALGVLGALASRFGLVDSASNFALLKADVPALATGIFLTVLTTGKSTSETFAAATFMCHVRGLGPSAVWTPRFLQTFAPTGTSAAQTLRALIGSLAPMERRDVVLTGVCRRVGTAAMRLATCTAAMIEKTPATDAVVEELLVSLQESMQEAGTTPMDASFIVEVKRGLEA